MKIAVVVLANDDICVCGRCTNDIVEVGSDAITRIITHHVTAGAFPIDFFARIGVPYTFRVSRKCRDRQSDT